MQTYLHLVLLHFNEGLRGILINGGKKQIQFLHSLLGLEIVGDETRVEETFHKEPVLDAGHIVAMQDLVLDPLHSIFGCLRHPVRVGQMSLVDHGKPCHGLLPDLELFVQGSLLDKVEKVLRP